MNLDSLIAEMEEFAADTRKRRDELRQKQARAAERTERKRAKESKTMLEWFTEWADTHKDIMYRAFQNQIMSGYTFRYTGTGYSKKYGKKKKKMFAEIKAAKPLPELQLRTRQKWNTYNLYFKGKGIRSIYGVKFRVESLDRVVFDYSNTLFHKYFGAGVGYLRIGTNDFAMNGEVIEWLIDRYVNEYIKSKNGKVKK